VQVIFLDSGLKPIGWSFVFLDDEVGLNVVLPFSKAKSVIKSIS